MIDDNMDIDALYDMYVFYKKKEEELKAAFNERAAELYANGMRETPMGKELVKQTRTTKKVDVMMLSTLHEARFKEIVESGGITIPAKSYKDFEGEISDCIESDTTTYFLLK